MSITDELREWSEDRVLNAELAAIADRIDAEADDNERFRRDVEPFCDRLREAAAERADVTMYGVDYVALPVDADGVPIHIGDRLTEPEFVPKGGKVVGIKLYSSLDNWLVNCGAWVDPRKCHHHHEPTVEDVLREFSCVLMGKREFDGDVTEAIAEFAAKLQLREDK